MTMITNIEIERQSIDPSALPTEATQDIAKKVDFELNEMQLKMTRIGAITNIIGGLLVIWILYQQINLSFLITWYAVLVLFNVINICFSFYFSYSQVIPENISKWLKAYHYLIMPPVCITWGMMPVLFNSADLHHQVYITALLLAVLISFSFATMSDFKASVISICGLLLPSLIFRIYSGTHALITTGHDPNLDIGLSICLFILGSFLIITCYIGYRLIKKSFNLSYINIALNAQLENMNKFLEERVKERTAELEDSLKLVKYQASHDLLTDLPNQRLLVDNLEKVVITANKNKLQFLVICFSINELEKINDGLGHHFGDYVIKTVAQRLQKGIDKQKDQQSILNHTIALSRKDVFVMLSHVFNHYEDVESQVQKLLAVFDEPVHTKNNTIKLTTSMGVALYPRDGIDPKTLLMNADAAMLSAKQKGGNSIHFYKAELNANISKQLDIENRLHTAIKNNEFILYYQPFVDLQTGLISGAEALIRWQNPQLGFVSPADFIPLAEANGIIIPIGQWVFYNACKQTKIWHDMGFPIKIAINLSAKQLHQKNMLKTLEVIIDETNIDPHTIEIELTETKAFHLDTIPIIKKLKEAGFGLSIDDFGTGYSGLSNLKLFSIDKLKIDKSFVDGVVTESDSQIIVTNTINLAKKLKIKVIAEGVENKEQFDFLKKNGCDMIQGYYFSKPIDVVSFTELLEKEKHLSIA